MSEEIKKYLYALSVVPAIGIFIVLYKWGQLEIWESIVYGALSQIGLFILAFGKKVWDIVEPILVRACANSTIAAANKMVKSPLFLRRYNEYVLTAYNLFNVKGLGLINAVKFEHIFVELSVDRSNPNAKMIWQVGDGNQNEQIEENYSIWEFIRESKSKQFDGIAWAVIGAPGSGKTSLLQNISITLAAQKEDIHKIPSWIPITLFLREHIEAIEQGVSLAELLQNHFGDVKKFPDLNPPENWFQTKLMPKLMKRGQCLILLDGLDEVADLDKRKVVSKWVDKQISTYSKSRFIITSRPQGYNSAPLYCAVVLKISPFSNSQRRKFIHNWYLLNDEKNAKEKAENLTEILGKRTSLKEISINPLLLTMIVMVHDKGALPGSRAELYRELCRALLEDWAKANEIECKWGKNEKLAILRPLAKHMMEINKAQIPYNEAKKIIVKPLESIGVSEDKMEEFLDELELRSGLFLEKATRKGEEEWGFVHLSFQEYLTAEYWKFNKNIEPEWSVLVDAAWWEETLRFYAAIDNAEPIINACEKTGSSQAFTLLNGIKEDDDIQS